MKCTNCGKNEATYHTSYSRNINGHQEQGEQHLCQECAEKLGLLKKTGARSGGFFSSPFEDSFFSEPFGGNLLHDFFEPQRSLFSWSGFDDLFDDFFTRMPALGAGSVQEQPKEQAAPATEQKTEEQPAEAKAPENRFARMRRLNALRSQMRRAVREENFEEAAKIRDELHTLENEQSE